MVSALEALLRLDAVDRAWEAEVEKHVCRVARFGMRSLPSLSDALACALFALLSSGCGLFMISQMRRGIYDHALGHWSAAGLLLLGCVLLFQAGSSLWGWRRCAPVVDAYEAARQRALEDVAPEHRPGSRVCLKCLRYTA